MTGSSIKSHSLPQPLLPHGAYDEFILMPGKISARSKLRLWSRVELEDNMAMQNLEPDNFADLESTESQTRTRNSFVLVISIWLIRTSYLMEVY